MTDVLSVDLDANGGTLVDLRLNQYPVEVDQPDTPFVLLVEELPELFVAQAGLLSRDQNAPNHRTRWEFDQDSYELQPGQDRLEVPLTWRDDSGLEVVATWIFYRGDYVGRSGNGHSQPERPGMARRALRSTAANRAGLYRRRLAFTNPERFSYTGAAVYSPEEKMTKRGFEEYP